MHLRWHRALGLVALVVATAAAACGGGGSSTAGTPGVGGGGSSSAAEQPGTKVQVMAVSSCDHSWVRPENLTDTYRTVLTGQVTLYAVYLPSDTSNTFDGGFGSQYVIVLRTAGQSSGVALHVKGGRVTWIERACPDLASLVASSRVKSFYVAPGGTPVQSQTPGSAGAPTGIPEVDHLIQAATSGNIVDLASLAGYQQVACAVTASATAPACR